jgi:hypothetical protein
MSAIAIIANGLVAIWLLLTLLYQFRPFSRVIGRYDVLRLLPRWTFFAPNPATWDWHVALRDRLQDGTYSEWVEVKVAGPRCALDAIWHPAKRARKILSDASQALVLMQARGECRRAIQLSLPYLLILNHCITQPASPQKNEVYRQFALVKTARRTNRKLRLVFVSDFHTP